MKRELFADTETTDLEDGYLIELGWSFGFDGESTPVHVVRCRPRGFIAYDAMGIHHITEASVINLQYFQERGDYQDIKRIFEENIFIAHNAKFDMGILFREGIEVRDFIDTKHIAKHFYPDAPNHRLQTLRYYLHCDIDETSLAHSAEGDVRVLVSVYEKLKQKCLELYPNEDPILKMKRMTTQPILLERFTFGKHKGETYQHVNQFDRSYIEWLYKSNHDDPDVNFTAGHWMGIRTQ